MTVYVQYLQRVIHQGEWLGDAALLNAKLTFTCYRQRVFREKPTVTQPRNFTPYGKWRFVTVFTGARWIHSTSSNGIA